MIKGMWYFSSWILKNQISKYIKIWRCLVYYEISHEIDENRSQVLFMIHHPHFRCWMHNHTNSCGVKRIFMAHQSPWCSLESVDPSLSGNYFLSQIHKSDPIKSTIKLLRRANTSQSIKLKVTSSRRKYLQLAIRQRQRITKRKLTFPITSFNYESQLNELLLEISFIHL